jgi:hypothetical protein
MRRATLHRTQRTREMSLDDAHTPGGITVALWQFPQEVDVIGQNHSPEDLERMLLPYSRDRQLKSGNILR